MTKREERLEERISDMKETIRELSLEDDNLEIRYCIDLDENNPYLFNHAPSTILRKCDPIQYSVGLSEYSKEHSNEELINRIERRIERLL